MDVRRTDRIWLIGGIVAIVIIVAAAWLLAISPKFAEADSVQAEADDTSIQLTRLKKEVSALKEQNAKKATYQAQLDKLVTNVPETYGMPVFLRSLQDSGTAVDVKVTDLSVGTALKSDTVNSAVELPLSLNASGSIENIGKFLVRLQQTQSRAVLIDTVSITSDAGDSTDATAAADAITANLTLTAFCTTSDLADSAKTDRTDVCSAS
ncbi:type 4a pilus biogenesis protein PilO [Actinoplanes sp. LDG1-06]|uniref:Type 4a pilus biogenesis protein PilO n=1 Tax=Paractinoplanes ovalisporus TaxID=2810368 RepID=A0ABS2AGG1_9ACTN|nr:type 4a pilus biogenesis protein PilO [Actinoplanes ovalisporus]MBM2618917.1 type 4a pilus biogenesis protein PilO [Actinoplanes ovalisporus]